MEEEKQSNRFSSIFDSASNIARKGIVSSARLLAGGIDKTSEFIITHTSEHEKPSDVSILPGIEKASENTSYYVGGTHRLIGVAVNETVKVVGNTWNSMPESETMKNFKGTEGYQIGMEIGKASKSAGLNIIGGVSEGFTLVKDSGVKATVDIVDHKYGENAKKAAQESLNIAGDVVGVYQLTHPLGLAGISATQMMKLQEEEEETKKSPKKLLKPSQNFPSNSFLL